jgi:hypothetical protein
VLTYLSLEDWEAFGFDYCSWHFFCPHLRFDLLFISFPNSFAWLLDFYFLFFIFYFSILCLSFNVAIILSSCIFHHLGSLVEADSLDVITVCGNRYNYLKTTQNYPLLKKGPVLFFDKHFSGSNRTINYKLTYVLLIEVSSFTS